MDYVITISVLLLLLILLWNGVRLWRQREGFADGGIDIAAFLTALGEYNAIYESACKVPPTTDSRCGAYVAPAGGAPTQAYKPPRLPGAASFNAAVSAWTGLAPFPPLAAADFGVKVPSAIPLNGEKEFIFYAAPPVYVGEKGNDRFINNSAVNTVLTPWEQWINTQLRVWTTAAGTVANFGTYIEIGGENYKFSKVFANPPEQRKDVLYVKTVKTGYLLGVTYTMTAATQNLRPIVGTTLENSLSAFELLLGADMKDQSDVNAAVEANAPVPVSVSSSAVVGAASSSAAAVAATRASGVTGEVLDLPELVYYEDAWFRNRALFAKMFGSVRAAATEVKSYAQTAGAGTEGQTYELTALKFLELDRLILKSATTNGVVNVRALQGYNLEVPFPYDPAMYDINNTMEEPSRSPIGLKCYDLSEVQRKIIAYLSSRPYESATMTNLQLLAKYRTNMCASYGYYSKDGVASCKCEGCCIPVDYKTTFGRRTGKAAANVNVAAMEAAAKMELGSADEDKCVHFNRPYRLKRRQLPVGVDEEDVCLKEGFSESGITTRTFTTDVGAAKATAGLMKGWRFFQQRMVPAYLPGTEGFEDDCLTPSLPSPYRLRRGKPKLMTCG
jgi:hypothetical protein